MFSKVFIVVVAMMLVSLAQSADEARSKKTHIEDSAFAKAIIEKFHHLNSNEGE